MDWLGHVCSGFLPLPIDNSIEEVDLLILCALQEVPLSEKFHGEIDHSTKLFLENISVLHNLHAVVMESCIAVLPRHAFSEVLDSVIDIKKKKKRTTIPLFS